MSAATVKKELYKTIDILSEEMLNELLNYADYLASKDLEKELPDSIVIKDEEDLKQKLEERIREIENGNAKFLSLEEVFEEIDKKI